MAVDFKKLRLDQEREHHRQVEMHLVRGLLYICTAFVLTMFVLVGGAILITKVM